MKFVPALDLSITSALCCEFFTSLQCSRALRIQEFSRVYEIDCMLRCYKKSFTRSLLDDTATTAATFIVVMVVLGSVSLEVDISP